MRGGENAKRKLRDLADKVRSAKLRVGFLEGATYPDGTKVALVAYMNEFGRSVHSDEGDYYQLPRPFFRSMISAKSPSWSNELGKLMKNNENDSMRCLELMGIRIKGQLQESITALVSPPLAPSTIARKGFAKPLIDTGHMLNSVDFEIT